MRFSGLRCAAAHSNELEIPNNLEIKNICSRYLSGVYLHVERLSRVVRNTVYARWNAGHYRFGSPCEIITGLPEGVVFRSKEQVN